MGSTFLSKYLSARFAGEYSKLNESNQKGLVVTISRDTGCDAAPIAEEVIKHLNSSQKSGKKPLWQFVSKEIFEKSAKELNIKAETFDTLENTRDKNFVEDILQSFSTEKYPSDYKIKKTYKEIIKSVAKSGGVIILGRGGVAIVNHNHKNLHVKLTAPLEWRVKKVAKEYGTTEAKALKHIKESDAQRDKFKKYYMGRKVQYTDYDVVLNVSSLTKKEIASTIEAMVDAKKGIS